MKEQLSPASSRLRLVQPAISALLAFFALVADARSGWQDAVQPVGASALSTSLHYAAGLDRMIPTYSGPTCRINGTAIGMTASGAFDESAALAALPKGTPSLEGMEVELALQRPGTTEPVWMTVPPGQSKPTLGKDAAGNWCIHFTGGRALSTALEGMSFATGGGKSFTGIVVNPIRMEKGGAGSPDYPWSYRGSGGANQVDVQLGGSVPGGTALFSWRNGAAQSPSYKSAEALPEGSHNILTLNCGADGSFAVFRNGAQLNTQQRAPSPSALEENAGTLRLGIDGSEPAAANQGQDFLLYGIIVSDRLSIPEIRTLHWGLARQAGWRRSLTLGQLPALGEVFDFGKTTDAGSKTAIPGLFGKANLVLNTAEVTNGKTVYQPAFSPASESEYGIRGLYAGDYKNVANVFQADTGYFSDQWEWTVWMIAMLDPAMASNNSLVDLLGMRSGPMTEPDSRGKGGIEAPWTVGRHHNNWVFYTNPTVAIDNPPEINFETDFAKWPSKVVQAPTGKTDLTHDEWGNAHIFAYRDRLHLQWVTQPGDPKDNIPPAMSVGDSDDHRPASLRYGVPYLIIIKYKPNPDLDRNNPATWSAHKQDSYKQIKAVPLTEVMAWDRADCSVATTAKGALAAPVADARIMSCGRMHMKYSFQGYRFAAGFIPGRITTDEEDLAIFYNGMNLANYLSAPGSSSK
ncbi:hypothetical protein TSACC_21088 [Terrimicrobium sacchariphilum]|uniref:Uncharacterized protein n=2 Tax=Terrimicrobium sacchariphilum TaxID=690879 RepID=A0A146G7J6_TERSA|nr:hypothetical protein TSACC_21088 [Terrimicrobium sacchariphilum]